MGRKNVMGFYFFCVQFPIEKERTDRSFPAEKMIVVVLLLLYNVGYRPDRLCE